MTLPEKSYIIAGGLSILLLTLIALVIFLATSSTDDNPLTDPPIVTNPDEVRLPFTNALIVRINNSTLWARDINSASSIYLIKNWTSPFRSFDFYRKKNIYFGSAIAGQAITSYSKQYPPLVQPGLLYANQIAVDYVHDKIYVLDGSVEKINIFDIQTANFNVVSIDLNQPKDIAIDPVERYLFILQISSILKTKLDGSLSTVIIERRDISVFELDVFEKRIYWATIRDIQSVDYAGQNLIVVKQMVNVVISLAVSNKTLFWLSPSINYENPTLSSCKITSGVCKDTSSAVFDDDAIEIKAYNFNTLQVSNPCKNTSNCEYMCINSNNKPQCICNMGWQLKNDSLTCEAVDEFFLYVQGDLVKGRVLDLSKNIFTAALLPFKINVSLLSKKRAIDFDFDVRNRELIFSDDRSINKIKLKPGSEQVLISGGSSKEGRVKPAVDWIARNVYYLYWYWNFIYIAVRNIDPYDSSTTDKPILLIRDEKTPKSLVVHPNRGFLFTTLADNYHKQPVQILRADLNGSGQRIFGQTLSISDTENGLAIDYEEDRLFWFDVAMNKVHSADLECSNLQTINASIIENPKTFNIYGNYIYVSNLTSVWRYNKNTGKDIVRVMPMFDYESPPIHGAKIFGKTYQFIDDNHPCAVNNGGCGRYCFAMPKVNSKLTRICECNDNEQLDSNGKNCIAFPKKYNETIT